jgi:hypothetical protein
LKKLVIIQLTRLCPSPLFRESTQDVESPDEQKPPADEIERRRHVRTAEANNRIEGFPPPSGAVLEICEAYIRGEIEARDLVAVYKKRQQLQP